MAPSSAPTPWSRLGQGTIFEPRLRFALQRQLELSTHASLVSIFALTAVDYETSKTPGFAEAHDVGRELPSARTQT